MANMKKNDNDKKKQRSVTLSDKEVEQIKKIANNASLTYAIRRIVRIAITGLKMGATNSGYIDFDVLDPYEPDKVEFEPQLSEEELKEIDSADDDLDGGIPIKSNDDYNW